VKLTTCSTCKASIFFGRFSSGKLSPFDAKPEAHGLWCIEPTVADGPRMIVRTEAPADALRYVTHFATCRDAAAHRKPR
jgi:hypothetical protein